MRVSPSSSSSRSESSSTLPRSVPVVPCTQKGTPGSEETTWPAIRRVAVAPVAAVIESVADHGFRASGGWPGTRESVACTATTSPSQVRVMSTQCKR